MCVRIEWSQNGLEMDAIMCHQRLARTALNGRVVARQVLGPQMLENAAQLVIGGTGGRAGLVHVGAVVGRGEPPAVKERAAYLVEAQGERLGARHGGAGRKAKEGEQMGGQPGRQAPVLVGSWLWLRLVVVRVKCNVSLKRRHCAAAGHSTPLHGPRRSGSNATMQRRS